MKNALCQIAKTILLYGSGIILSYPYNILICSIISDNIQWLPLLCLFMAVTGILLWTFFNRRRIRRTKWGKDNLALISFLKGFVIQFLTVCVIMFMIAVKEFNQIYISPIGLYQFFTGVFGNEETAMFLSYTTMPVINIAYMLIVSLNWLFYNIMDLLAGNRTDR